MGQKQKPEVFYKVPKPPLPLLYMCVFFNYLLICNYQTTHKTEKSQSRGDMYPRSQHVGTFIYDLPSILPQARPHSHTDPCSDIRKVSSPIQAVTELTLHPEAGQHPPPLSLSAAATASSPPSEFNADLLQRASLLPDLRQTAAHQENQTSLLLFVHLTPLLD